MDSVVLTSAGSSFHHCDAKIEKSCDFADRLLLALNDGRTRRPTEVVCLPICYMYDNKCGKKLSLTLYINPKCFMPPI